MERQEENGNGNETRIYERALEISRSRLTELTWNNILYEANLDVSKAEAEENKVSDELVELRLQLQQSEVLNLELSNQRDDTEQKLAQVETDYNKLQDLGSSNESLQNKIKSLQDLLGDLESEDMDSISAKLSRLTTAEQEQTRLRVSLEEANEKLTLSDKTSSSTIIENNEFKKELEELRPRIKQLESQAIKGRNTNNAYAELEQEFLKREQKFNEMHLSHNEIAVENVKIKNEKQEVESALVTQKKLYTELLQRNELQEQDYKLELEKIKENTPTPKKRGRPKKNNGETSQDGGVLE